MEVGILLERRARFIRLADDQASLLVAYGVNREAGCWSQECFDSQGRFTRDWAERLDRWCVHFAAMERKWRRAAGQPWMAVEPDPPRP
jgi:hypothetical protein